MNRRKENKMNNVLSQASNIKFKYLNLDLSSQAVILLCIFGIVCLFFPWIIDNENNLSWNSFNAIAWNIWFLLILIYLTLIAVIISNNYKEKIKLYADISFKNHFMIISSWLASVFFWIIAVSFVNWLSTMWQNIVHWKWLVLSMATWVLIIVFWLVIRNNFKKNNSEIILEHLNYTREKVKEKDNMTLPF